MMSLASSSVSILPRAPVRAAARSTRRASPVFMPNVSIAMRSKGVNFDPLRVVVARRIRATPRSIAIRASTSERPPASELQRMTECEPARAPWWKGAAKGAAALALAAALTLGAPADALAARSSGRMGGSSFRSAAPSRSYSSPGAMSSSRSAMSSTGPSMMSRSMIAPTIFVPMGGYGYGMGMGGMGYGFGNLISLAFIAIVVMAFLDNIKNMFGGDGIQLGGDAIVNTLFGDNNPGGKTPVTWYPETITERSMHDMDLTSGDGLTHLYYSKGDELWPFGFGLSYTTFRFALDEQASRLTASTADMHEAHAAYYRRGGGNDPHAPLLCAVNVTNTGTVGSDVVVLGFLRNPTALAAEDHPLKELFSFERLKMLPAGATTQVLLSIPAQVISLVDAAGTERLVAADYPLELGVDGSAEGQAVRGGKLVLTGAARTLFEMPNFSSSN